MDRKLEQLISDLKGKKRRYLDDRTLSVDERARKSGLDRECVEAYDSYQTRARNQRIVVVGTGALVAAGLCAMLASPANPANDSGPSISAHVNTSSVISVASDIASVTTNPSFDFERVLLGVRSLERAFEENRQVHVYTLSKFADHPGVGGQHYRALVQRYRHIAEGSLFSEQALFDLTSPDYSALINDPLLVGLGAYEFIPAATILERGLRAGGEAHYDIYHSNKDGLCLIELVRPDLMIVPSALARLNTGSSRPEDLSDLRRYIFNASRLDYGNLSSVAIKSSLFALAQSLVADLGPDRSHRYEMLRRILDNSMRHSVESVGANMEFDFDGGEHYTLIGNMHNHNWGRDESNGDLELSKFRIALVAVYEQGQGFRTRHLLVGKALASGRTLSIQGPHDEWFLSNPQNIETPWEVSVPRADISHSTPRIQFSSTFDGGIDYALCCGEGGFWYQHFTGSPREVNADLQPGFRPSAILLISPLGRYKTITLN